MYSVYHKATCAAQLCDIGCSMSTLSRKLVRSALHTDAATDALAQRTAVHALFEAEAPEAGQVLYVLPQECW
jgi:hypothetical protein